MQVKFILWLTAREPALWCQQLLYYYFNEGFVVDREKYHTTWMITEKIELSVCHTQATTVLETYDLDSGMRRLSYFKQDHLLLLQAANHQSICHRKDQAK